MKKRLGFVSNSSSSSFVVVLPRKISELFVDIDMEKVYAFLDNFNKYEDDGDKIMLADLIMVLNKFEQDGYYDESDCYDNEEDGLPKRKMSITTDFFREVLPDCVVASIETSSDRGCIELMETSKIEKIYKIINPDEKR